MNKIDKLEVCERNGIERIMRSVLLCVGHVIGYVKTFVQLFGFFTPDGIVSCPFFSGSLFLCAAHAHGCSECICICCFLIGFSLTQFMLTDWHDTRSDRRIKQWGELLILSLNCGSVSLSRYRFVYKVDTYTFESHSAFVSTSPHVHTVRF